MSAQDDFLERVRRVALLPNAEAITKNTKSGSISVVAFEPMGENLRFLSVLGWDGISPVFAMSSRAAEVVAASTARLGDHTTGRWLRRRHGPRRVFLVAHRGTLLVNMEQERISIEPGSTDAEMKAAAPLPAFEVKDGPVRTAAIKAALSGELVEERRPGPIWLVRGGSA
jgi:hypothetical protein